MSIEHKDWHVANHVKKARNVKKDIKERLKNTEHRKEVLTYKDR